jgi:cytochrome c oxidase subunit 2
MRQLASIVPQWMDRERNMNRRRISLALLAWFGVITFEALAQDANAIRMTAKKYEFQPDVIRVKKGNHVKLIITATDKEHGFKLEAFHIDEKLEKGKATEIEFTADQTGTFPFQCSHFCGLGHKKMKGELIVE